MAYLSLYRKWRPQTFDDVVGQQHVVRTLINALNENRTAHAYIFSGPRGTGKTTVARLLAKGLNCEQGPTGNICNDCSSCRHIAAGSALDVIEIDGASNRGIDEVRELRERVHYAPTQSAFKVYIIDEVHMLTNEAFNALLKILEEPPSHVVFVFATTEVHKIPATILSRCQRFDFRRFQPNELVGQLEKVLRGEKVPYEADALALVARHAEGGMRDALGVLDQCIAYRSEGITAAVVNEVIGAAPRERLEQFVSYARDGDLGKLLALVRELDDTGNDLRQFTRDLIGYLRDLMIIKATPREADALVTLLAEEKKPAHRLAESLPLEGIVGGLEILAEVEPTMRWAPTPSLGLEMAAIRFAQVCQPKLPGEQHGTAAMDPAPQSAPASPAKSITADGPAQIKPAVQARPPAPAPATPTTEPEAGRVASAASTSRPGGAQAVGRHTAAGTGRVVGGQSAPVADGHVQQVWTDLLQSLRQERLIQTEAFLREGSPVALTETTLVVLFSKERSFHHDNMIQSDHKQATERLVSRIVGRPLQLDIHLGSVDVDIIEASAPSPTGAGEIKEVAGRDPSARRGGHDAGARQQQAAALDRSDGPASVAAAPEDGDPPGLPDEPVLRAAIQLFEGTVIDVRDEEDKSV